VNSPPANSTETSQPPALEWLRKRDGEVVRFDLEKLTRSLTLAAADSGESHSPDAVVELARMASFFLRANLSGETIGSDDVAEWIDKSLRETAQHGLADSYTRYQQRKLWARNSLVVQRELGGPTYAGEPDELVAAEPRYWDKSQIVQSLRVRLNLDARRAREIAGHVERVVLLGRFTAVTTDLIRELINNELQRWGLTERLAPSQQIRISTAELKRQLTGPAGPTLASRLVAGRIWRDFALNEVVSREVADADRRGLLRIHGLDSPATLAASCVDCCSLIRLARGSRESITQFGSALSQTVESTASLLAIDGIEPWLTLIAEPKDSPAELAELFWIELQSRLRNSPTHCVLNLYGGLPQDGNPLLGAGPLFSEQPLSAEREFAGAVSQELLGLFQRDGRDWPNLRVDWHWYLAPDPVQSALTGRLMRVIAEGHSVAVVYDRGPVALGEGLRRLGESVRPVLDYVGISLPHLWRDAGSPRALPALEDGLRQTIQLAIRAAIQKREFVRRLIIEKGDKSNSSTQIGLIPFFDSAVVALFPVGLDWTVRQLVGKTFAEDEGALRLAETLVRYLREAAEREARHFALGVAIDAPPPSDPIAAVPSRTRDSEIGPRLEGMNSCAPTIGLRRHIHATGRLHAIAQAGTLICPRAAVPLESIDRLMETIDWACRNAELVRLRLHADRAADAQAVVTWPES
jgi:hypothetical protein